MRRGSGRRANIAAMLALLLLVPLAAWTTLGDLAPLRQNRLRVAVEPGEDGWVDYAGSRLRLDDVTVIDALPTFDGTWAPPPGYQLWQATVTVMFVDRSEPIGGCDAALVSTAGDTVDTRSIELAAEGLAVSTGVCDPADLPFGATPPEKYVVELPFLTAADFEPTQLRIVLIEELPRYASFMAERSHGDG